MTKKRFDFWLFDQETIDWLNSIPNRSEYIRDLMTKVKNGIVKDFDKLDLKDQKTLVEIKYKEVQTKIKEFELEHWKTFGKAPSSSGEKALKVHAKTETIPPEQTSYDPPEEKDLRKIIETKWNNWVDVLKQEKKDSSWTVVCRLCSTGFVQIPTRDQAIDRLKKHLEDTHSDILLEK